MKGCGTAQRVNLHRKHEGSPRDDFASACRVWSFSESACQFAGKTRLPRASERKGRCFVATLALGECAETSALRAFRDLYLRRTAPGRQFIATYYRLGPAACDLLSRHPRMLSAVRLGLVLAGRMAAWVVARRLAR